jgi:hypothetical protein
MQCRTQATSRSAVIPEATTSKAPIPFRAFFFLPIPISFLVLSAVAADTIAAEDFFWQDSSPAPTRSR